MANDDDVLRYLWLAVSVALTVVTTACLAVPVGILTSPGARRNPFNMYLVFLMVPDAFFTGMCAMTCFMNFSAGQYYSPAMCTFQNWYTVFGVCGNAWLNSVVAYQLHKMLRFSYVRRRYFPPGTKVVALQAAGVYAYSAGIASMGAFYGVSQEKSEELVSNGTIGCFPTKFRSSLLFWLFFAPAMFVIPLGIIACICVDVYRRKLLPRARTTTKLLAVYFFRLVAIFAVMWIPYFIITVASDDPWLLLFGGLWGHFQIVTSAAFSVTKPDVRRATLRLLCCAFASTDHTSSSNDENADGMRKGGQTACQETIDISSHHSGTMMKHLSVTSSTPGMNIIEGKDMENAEMETDDELGNSVAIDGGFEERFCAMSNNKGPGDVHVEDAGDDDLGENDSSASTRRKESDAPREVFVEEDYWQDVASSSEGDPLAFHLPRIASLPALRASTSPFSNAAATLRTTFVSRSLFTNRCGGLNLSMARPTESPTARQNKSPTFS